MSFQGDVAGIGLGELLQGLARGERNGVLTLTGKRMSSTVGLRKGQLYLLPGNDEDEGLWRDRCVRAFAESEDGALESSRRAVIARAQRLENFYQMIEADNVHFRFEPGPLPPPPSAALRLDSELSSGVQRSVALDHGHDQEFEVDDPSPWGQGLPVEYLLLEHARISDEIRTGVGGQLSGTDIPRALDAESHEPAIRDFLEQCNGSSTIQEIADRLGWPLSKCRGVIGEYLSAGLVRLAPARELLTSAQREMEQGRAGRAAARLAGWIQRSVPGPLSAADAQLLFGEWDKGRLAKTLAVSEPRVARALLRRLDRHQPEQKLAHARWRALAEAHRQDEITLLRELSLRLVSSAPNARTFADLLRLAHSFHEQGQPLRTRMLLRLCASHLPENSPVRVELGRRMLDAGLVQEGTRWLLSTARELLDDKNGEAAVLPIRAILRVLPDQPEARALLEQAQLVKVKRKRRRWTLSVGLSTGLALSLVAVVQYHGFREAERWASEVEGASPSEALARLNEEFGEEPPKRIAEIQKRLQSLHQEELRRTFESWTASYREADETCRYGDPLLGFERALALPAPPDGSAPSTPDTNDLLGQLASRLSALSRELDLPADASIDQINEEERFLDLLLEFQRAMSARTLPATAHSFQFRVQELVNEVKTRRETRAAARAKLSAKEREKSQDILLATARAHAQAGDLDRALDIYEELLKSDPDLAAIAELQAEIAGVRAHHAALQSALALCEQGRHVEAEESLKAHCERLIEHLLPCRIDSLPAGARVTISTSSEDKVRTTPFVLKSAIGEHVKLTFERDGYLPRTIEISRPHDLEVALHQFPERSWTSQGKIEAGPIPSGDDHIVCDRRGRVARLGADSRTRWEVQLETLGGIARTPVFLPNKSGWLLIVSEDGQAWLVQSQTGDIEGPREIGAVPVVGPELTRSGVSVQFKDGRVAVWSDRLEPIFYQADALVNGGPLAAANLIAGDLKLLRRSAGSGTELTAPKTGWSVEVIDGEYRVVSPDGLGFSALRQGEWNYVAWEAPKALVPQGRLWISDAGGLRSYVPDAHRSVRYRRRE